jgi:6-pyruvoyltetrahydropterin/6-carboxytetrahydropterin synthase
MTFDYQIYKKAIIQLCDSLDEVVLLPLNNSALKIEETHDYIYAFFDSGKEKIPFLRRDVKLLELSNITVEELSYWFLQKLVIHAEGRPEDHIHSIEVKVSSGPGQSGSSFWKKP